MGASAPLVLASASPRRQALLERIGVVPTHIIAADLDETPCKNELPLDYARRIAQAKVTAICEGHRGAYVLAADTAVACGRRILPKAETREQAEQCLQLLSGRRHKVITAVALVTPEGIFRAKEAQSVVQFKRLIQAETAAYLDSGEWEGKAGGYAIQGRAEAFIPFISGSYSNVVGLPLYETRQLLISGGYPL